MSEPAGDKWLMLGVYGCGMCKYGWLVCVRYQFSVSMMRDVDMNMLALKNLEIWGSQCFC